MARCARNRVRAAFIEFSPADSVPGAQVTAADDLNGEIERLKAEAAHWRARAEAAESLAERDVLTPVLNRRGFEREMSRAMAFCRRHRTEAALLYLDLDGFKAINDQLGHQAGDAALIACAEILNRNLRESDAVGRLGGDEFAVLLLGTDAKGAKHKAQSLTETLSKDGFAWQGQVHPLNGSFGVRAFTGQTDPADWLAEADAAMWVRKKGR